MILINECSNGTHQRNSNNFTRKAKNHSRGEAFHDAVFLFSPRDYIDVEHSEWQSQSRWAEFRLRTQCKL